MKNEKIITRKQAEAEAKKIFKSSDASEMGWTLKEFINDYIESLKADGYIVK